jgi:hypothetical protein
MDNERKKPRIIISTDIGGKDPDDYQSLVHYLLYSDMVKTEALISSPPFYGTADNILETLECYRADFSKLKTRGNYPEPRELEAVTVQGAEDTGSPGPEKNTSGSEKIIECALAEDESPLFVLLWGSMTDLAQALYVCPEITRNIRVYSIGSWNTKQDPESRNYIYTNHPDLWWIESDETFRGMYMGGNQEADLGNEAFVELHVRGHGALGDFYAGKKKDIKMADTSSFLYILSPLIGNTGNWDDPTAPSWGGSYMKPDPRRCYWKDSDSPEYIYAGKKGANTINRWREQILRNWQTRMDRCLM